MITDAFLAAEDAAHRQREHAAQAARTHLARLALAAERCVTESGSLTARVIAAFRPATRPCATC